MARSGSVPGCPRRIWLPAQVSGGTPVREALMQLTADGFVTFAPNRGAQVASWSEDDLEEIFQLRALLES